MRERCHPSKTQVQILVSKNELAADSEFASIGSWILRPSTQIAKLRNLQKIENGMGGSVDDYPEEIRRNLQKVTRCAKIDVAILQQCVQFASYVGACDLSFLRGNEIERVYTALPRLARNL